MAYSKHTWVDKELITPEKLNNIENGIAAAGQTATKLETPRKISVDLSSSQEETFDGSRDATLGVTGLLLPENGGTGVSSLYELESSLGISGISNIMTTKRWSGRLADGIQTNIDFTNPFSMGFTFAPIVLFSISVTSDNDRGTLYVYDGSDTTHSYGVSGNVFSDNYLFMISGTAYIRLGVPYDTAKAWRGNLGIKIDGDTGSYNVYALFIQDGRQR